MEITSGRILTSNTAQTQKVGRYKKFRVGRQGVKGGKRQGIQILEVKDARIKVDQDTDRRLKSICYLLHSQYNFAA